VNLSRVINCIRLPTSPIRRRRRTQNELPLLLNKIKALQNVCKVVSLLKSQLIEELPHYGHDALYLKNDEITTGLLNNITEIKIHLLTGQLLYFHNEEGQFVDLTSNDILNKLQNTVTRYGIGLPQSSDTLRHANMDDLSHYLKFAIKANKSLELFRMKLRGSFTQVQLWPHGFDFSIEWFPKKNGEQIGVGISPGHDQYKSPYLYVNPYPFEEKMLKQPLDMGIWHTAGWSRIKVEWKDLEYRPEQEISKVIFDLFLIAKRNFEKPE
jgi:hypothetical protein